MLIVKIYLLKLESNNIIDFIIYKIIGGIAMKSINTNIVTVEKISSANASCMYHSVSCMYHA